MSIATKKDARELLTDWPGSASVMLSPERERQLLADLASCKQALADGPDEATGRRYMALRDELALANMRLVAHVAKRYRNRGIAYADLVQEGFCGLLGAIDRFDLSHGTKLSTYATWWIRHAVQSAVAAGAYPVRLTPRHLRQLALGQEDVEQQDGPGAGRDIPESFRRIHAATQPTVSLDETRLPLPSPNAYEVDHATESDVQDAVDKWMEALRPRERQVLSYRFGLGGGPRLSLSQVGKILAVSKERVRQIERAALDVLRANVRGNTLLHSI